MGELCHAAIIIFSTASNDIVYYDEDDDADNTAQLPDEPASDPSDLSASETETDAEGDVETELEERVFSNCPLKKSTSNLLLMQYSVRHNLTQEAVADLLSLLSIHCPSPNSIPSSLYCFQKLFPSLHTIYTVHYFCSSCLQEVPGKEILICPNADCGKSLKEFPALNLLERMFL